MNKANIFKAKTAAVTSTFTKVADQAGSRKRIIFYNSHATDIIYLSLFDNGDHKIPVEPGKIMTWSENAPLNAFYAQTTSTANLVIWES